MGDFTEEVTFSTEQNDELKLVSERRRKTKFSAGEMIQTKGL